MYLVITCVCDVLGAVIITVLVMVVLIFRLRVSAAPSLPTPFILDVDGAKRNQQKLTQKNKQTAKQRQQQQQQTHLTRYEYVTNQQQYNSIKSYTNI